MIALLVVALALLGLAALHGQLALRVRELEDERAEERRREASEREQALRPEVTGLGWAGHISTVAHLDGNTHRAPAPRSPDVPAYWQERL